MRTQSTCRCGASETHHTTAIFRTSHMPTTLSLCSFRDAGLKCHSFCAVLLTQLHRTVPLSNSTQAHPHCYSSLLSHPVHNYRSLMWWMRSAPSCLSTHRSSATLCTPSSTHWATGGARWLCCTYGACSMYAGMWVWACLFDMRGSKHVQPVWTLTRLSSQASACAPPISLLRRMVRPARRALFASTVNRTTSAVCCARVHPKHTPAPHRICDTSWDPRHKQV